MGWVEDLQGKVIGLDTAPLIYIKRYSGWGEASVYVLISKLALCEPE